MTFTIRSLVFILLLIKGLDGFAQAIDTEFGKNRVQFSDKFKYWNKYESDNFIVLWYGKNRYLAQSAIQMAEYDHTEIRKLIEHRMNDKIEIIVYADLADLKQTNIGTEQAFTSKTGETKIVGSKLFLYFDGNHHNVRKKLREGIASVYLDHMLYGSNFQEIIQNSVLMDLPLWFREGLVAYAGSTWNVETDDLLRDLLYHHVKLWSFEKLAEKNPRIAGHSFWYFIGQNYGRAAIANILYLTRISRDIQSSIQFVLNTSMERLRNEWADFFDAWYKNEEGNFSNNDDSKRLKLKNKKHQKVSHISLNKDGRLLAYVYNDIGKIRIAIYDFDSGKSKILMKYGSKNNFQETDFNYPLLDWHPQKNELTVLYQKRDKIYCRVYDIASGKHHTILLPDIFQRVYSLDRIDERFLLLSASIESNSDLFIFDTENRTFLQITNDFYDDLDATYSVIDGRKGILWSSNRQNEHILPQNLDTILPLHSFNIFFYPTENMNDNFAHRKADKRIERMTDSKVYNHFKPVTADENHIMFLSEESGIVNTYVYDYKGDESYPITSFDRNIVAHAISNDGQKYVYLLVDKNTSKVFAIKHPDVKTAVDIFQTEFRTASLSNLGIEEEAKVNENNQSRQVIKPGYLFQSRFDDPDSVEPLKQDKDKSKVFLGQTPVNYLHFIGEHPTNIIKFDPVSITASRLEFKLHEVVTRLDNEVLFEGLELFQGQNSEVNQLPMGILVKSEVKDLFEDYNFTGGIRIPTTFNGSEYFLIFDNRKRLIDKRFAFYRRTLTEAVDFNVVPSRRSKKEILLGLFRLSYPFDIYRSVRLTTSLRFDRNLQSSVDQTSFDAPILNEKRLGLKLEYVFDNTIDFSNNIKHGSRYKFFVEGLNLFNLEFADGFNLSLSNGFTGVVGFDARHYIPVLKYSVLALRGVGASSFGNKKNVYFLGGVNNTLFNRFDQSIPLPTVEDFAFKTYAPHLRGFNANIRNGSTFLLSNIEFRLPVFNYFLGLNKGASFFKNFQIVGFLDAGLAWYGSGPFSKENALNTVFIDRDVIKLEIRYFRDPLVIGYGVGVRTKLLGYFVRFDYGWGVETRHVQSPVAHLSFGYDF